MPNETVLHETICHSCNEQKVVEIPQDEWYAWVVDGMHIQEALPSVSADDRELLISQTCPVCWDELFNQDLDDEYDDEPDFDYDLEYGDQD